MMRSEIVEGGVIAIIIFSVFVVLGVIALVYGMIKKDEEEDDESK